MLSLGLKILYYEMNLINQLKNNNLVFDMNDAEKF